MKIYLVRHGETIENKTGIHQGQALQGTLSEKGINQAIKVADRLKVEKFDVIFSSDLGRASNTAREIAKHHSDTPIHFVKELRERYTGEIGGKRKEEIDYNNFPKDAETDTDLQKRGKAFIDEIYQEYKDKIVLLVGHGTIRNNVMGLEGEGGEKIMPCPAEMNDMKALLEQAMIEGAFGLSTGLIYPPGRNSLKREVIELLQVVSKYGGVHVSHIRCQGPKLLESSREFIETNP